MANKNDDKVLQLKAQIAKKKEDLEKIGKFTPVTNCSIELDGARYNLHTLDKDKALTLMVRLNVLLMSAKYLGVEDEFKVSQFILSDWMDDIKARVEQLNKKQEESKLKTMESKLDKLLSEEKKTELELKELEDLLK